MEDTGEMLSPKVLQCVSAKLGSQTRHFDH